MFKLVDLDLFNLFGHMERMNEGRVIKVIYKGGGAKRVEELAKQRFLNIKKTVNGKDKV